MLITSTSIDEGRGDDPAFDPRPGTIVDDYEIIAKLGAGGMGSVYEARHLVIDRRVALKVLHRELSQDADAMTRFVQEARAANRIRHPGIVDVFGFGKTLDGRAFLAMELLEGQSLRQRLASGDRITLATTCQILAKIADVLIAAHAAGIVHRDLKPDNVFLLRDHEVKLLDFGIAKLSIPTGLSGRVDVTQPGVLIGTPQYIAPEQARGMTTTPSADIYGLGVLAFEMITGRPPFVATDAIELLAKHITLKAPAPSDFDPTLPPEIDALIIAMLAKEPEQRPSALSVCEALASLQLRASAYDQLAQPRGMPANGSADTKVIETQAAPSRAKRALWLAIGALALAAIVVRGVVWWFDTDKESPATGRVVKTVQTEPAAAPPRMEAKSSVKEPPIEMPDDAVIRAPNHPKVKIRAKSPHPPMKPTEPVTPPAKPTPPDDDAIRDPYAN